MLVDLVRSTCSSLRMKTVAISIKFWAAVIFTHGIEFFSFPGFISL